MFPDFRYLRVVTYLPVGLARRGPAHPMRCNLAVLLLFSRCRVLNVESSVLWSDQSTSPCLMETSRPWVFHRCYLCPWLSVQAILLLTLFCCFLWFFLMYICIPLNICTPLNICIEYNISVQGTSILLGKKAK